MPYLIRPGDRAKQMEMVQDGRHIQDGGQTILISSIIVATKNTPHKTN